ncbi:MAG: peptidoglycan-associated lipoprotein Pal [Betaproteobacteria bacterium]|nr:peptidoglycan-associated lipoprotein Pal [Betaproteobacteria bacterium]
MRRQLHLTFAAMVLATMYGCASQIAKEADKAAVEDRTPGATVAAAPGTASPPQQPGGVASKPLPPGAGAGGAAPSPTNPLKDPGNILSKRSIFYDLDSDVIKEEFQPMLRAHAKYLTDRRSAKVLVQGNTDERGGREYNLALGQRRAEAVKRALVLMGAQEAQVEAVSLGKEKPRCEEHNEACWSQNRRSDLLHAGEF